jgi:trimethylamine--corrinoid protein Co-methyltransferase
MTINYQIANLLQARSFGLNVFSQDDLEQIHMATLDVLWNIGIQVKSPQALKIFGDSGCTVDAKTDVVKIPPHLVEDAVISTPATYRAHAIDPVNDYVAGGSKTGFVNFGEAPALLDPETRKVRAATKKDVDDTVRFIDTLDNVVGWERPIWMSKWPAFIMPIRFIPIHPNMAFWGSIMSSSSKPPSKWVRF